MMFDKIKQMMEMKKQADAIKKQLDDVIVDVEPVKGIKIKITGSQKFQGIELDDGYGQPENKKKLEEDLLRSINAAIEKSQQVAAQKMKDAMPQMPGF